eukprot:485550_1
MPRNTRKRRYYCTKTINRYIEYDFPQCTCICFVYHAVYFMGTFLENIGMERYFDAFKVNGLLDETSLKCVNKQTLILLGIDNESSHEAIMKGIKSHLSLHSPTLYI